jgi:radical SAM protein with 4Fe4S-binding SPASM domain
MRWEVRGKYYPTTPDQKSYEGAGVFFREGLVLPAGRYRARIQILFSEFAAGEEINVTVRIVATGETLGSETILADPLQRAHDQIYVSFELKNEALVDLCGRAETNNTTTLLRAMTILEDPEGLLQRSAFYYEDIPSPSIKTLKRFNIGTTGVCNASCIHCPTNKGLATSKNGHMSMTLFSKIVDNLAEGSFAGVITFGMFGEPLSDPFLTTRLQIIKKSLPGCQIAIATNAGYFDEEKHGAVIDLANSVGIHIESLTEDVYDSLMKPLRLSRVLPAVMKFIEVSQHRGRYNTHIMVPTHKANIFEYPEIVRFFQDRGVSVYFSSLSGRAWDDGPFRKLSLAPTAGVCLPSRLVDALFVDWDGKVLPCCFDFSKSMPLGDLNHQTIEEVFSSEEWRTMAERFRRMEWSKNKACASCRTDHPHHVGNMLTALIGNEEFIVKEVGVRQFRSSLSAKRGVEGTIISNEDTRDGHVVFGPYIKIPRGNYRVYFDLDVFDLSKPSGLVLDVCAGGKDILSNQRFSKIEKGKFRPELDFAHTTDSALQFRIDKRGSISFEYYGATLVRR